MATKSIPALCWNNGQLMPALEAQISVLDHGFLYGDGVFEGIRFRQKAMLHLSEHLQRLRESAQGILLQIPYSDAEIEQALEALLLAYSGQDGYIRLIVTRGMGPLGIDSSQCNSAAMLIIADQLSLVGDSARLAASLASVNIRRIPADCLDPRIKSLNYLNHVLARQQARQAGADEALMLNLQGRVTEGSADNVFMVRNGTLLTPSVSEGLLAGITRKTLLELAREAGIEVQETALTLFDFYTADEVFLSGTGAGLIAVAQIDQRLIKHSPGPVFTLLDQAYQARWQAFLEAR